ncbi:bifunctional riboflavin kinase/FAD synthetase [Arsenicitalea aurantiaca]|uniref:Riboflavin biosynthesis protein n=1 Tax=Arsenicitalea aurantiaca TaxID=1783274 RepID=A0A433XAZ3_9HYPH|nr:bifunctional riboflavin kinase/FAD synthetase [Arsenicitalea aurantiaca]RUT31200.1 bifunctional riboflavin kinase/FAD synthetase [Arsenicitalea aurantiaca]
MSAFVRLSSLDAVPAALKGAEIAIGNFDGCHLGHQAVFAALKARAAARGVPAVVLTFEPHPRDVFAPEPFMFRLTDGDAKARLVEALGLDGIVIMNFTRAFSQVEAEDFVSRYLLDALAVSGVIVGDDFHFGRGRRGTPQFLRDAGAAHGFEVITIPLLGEGAPISSSRVRAALGEGDVETANGLLGYHWFVSGEIVAGDRRGRELGFPTANMAPPPGFRLAQGIYAVRARLGERLLDGVASFGKPMFDNAAPPFETHLFDFAGEIYGERLSVALVAHIRGQALYDGLDALTAAIRQDSAEARARLRVAAPLGPLDRKLGFFG